MACGRASCLPVCMCGQSRTSTPGTYQGERGCTGPRFECPPAIPPRSRRSTRCLQSIDCLPPLDALASVESALHLGYLSERGLDSLTHHGSLRVRTLLGRLDRGAQSGFETHTRVKLLEAGYRVRTQVHIPGAGRLDLLVESCVGIETDGAAWHGADRFIHDRTKDLIVEGQGIRVLRIARPHIFEEWPRTLATIDRMVKDARAATSEKRGRGRRSTE
jgi:very-short-patch-repair endonuclease